jgi:hypothetical protein
MLLLHDCCCVLVQTSMRTWTDLSLGAVGAGKVGDAVLPCWAPTGAIRPVDDEVSHTLITPVPSCCVQDAIAGLAALWAPCVHIHACVCRGGAGARAGDDFWAGAGAGADYDLRWG